MDLDASLIEVELARLGAALGRPLSVATVTNSTNEDARRAAASGAPHGAAFLADAQTAGRGRGSHTWHSPAGQNVYLSVVLRPNVAATEVAPITLAVGLAVARTVSRLIDGGVEGGRAAVASASATGDASEIGGARLLRTARRAPSSYGARGALADRGVVVASPRVMLKWPNDVYVDGHKIAGVLVEGQLRGDRVASLVAGIGLNVHARAFPPELERKATSLAIAGAETLDRSRIAAGLLAELGVVVASYELSRLAQMIEEIRALDFLRDRHVAVGGLRGVGCGVDERGGLLVRTSAGEVETVASGEVALRG